MPRPSGATEASLRAVADLAPGLLWRTDSAGLAYWFNHRWLEYRGRAAGDLIGASTTYELTPDGVHCTIQVNTAA